MLSVCYGNFAWYDIMKDLVFYGPSNTIHELFSVMALVVTPEDSMLQLKLR